MKQKLLFLFFIATSYIFCMEEIELKEKQNIQTISIWTLTKMKEIADNIDSDKYDEQLNYYTFKPDAVHAAVCYLNEINADNNRYNLSYLKNLQEDKTNYHNLIKDILYSLKNGIDGQQQATSCILSPLSEKRENLIEQKEEIDKSYTNQRFMAYSLSVGNILVGIFSAIWVLRTLICLGN